MFLGDLGAVEAGETQPFPLSFAKLLASGDSLVSAQAGVKLWPQSPTADANAAGLLIGSPFISGSGVVAVLGGAYAPGSGGFQLGAVYSAWAQVVTTDGYTLEAWGNVSVGLIAPPAFSPGATPTPNEFSESANFTPAAPGTYYLTAAGLTLTIPAGSVGGDILIVDKTGAPNLTISGTILNAPSGLSPITAADATFTLRWSALFAGYFML